MYMVNVKPKTFCKLNIFEIYRIQSHKYYSLNRILRLK